MEKYKSSIFIWGLVILVGLGIGLYPVVSRSWQHSKQEEWIRLYRQGKLPMGKELEGESMLGILWIPKLECELPIFEGTEEKTLEMGVGLLEGSSRISAEETGHAVFCAHSGLPKLYAFDRIDELEKEDLVYVITHDFTLEYTVTQQSTVLPEEVHLLLQPSLFANQITLLTCTPYGINSHRLLVQAKLSRCDYGSVS